MYQFSAVSSAQLSVSVEKIWAWVDRPRLNSGTRGHLEDIALTTIHSFLVTKNSKFLQGSHHLGGGGGGTNSPPPQYTMAKLSTWVVHICELEKKENQATTGDHLSPSVQARTIFDLPPSHFLYTFSLMATKLLL